MIEAYQESKLYDKQILLGEYFHVAVNGYYLSIDEAMNRLLLSKYARLIENDVTSIIYGKTGSELYCDVMNETSDEKIMCKYLDITSNSNEYWAGWILAYLQCNLSKSFDSIIKRISMKDILNQYHPYHEMDERSFVEDVYRKYFAKISGLQMLRKKSKLSQRELSEKSGVNVRTIQMLEQKQNDINHAHAITLYNLAKTLHCKMEDLID
jgi:DNA-binding XRE family transcriptional regulator